MGDLILFVVLLNGVILAAIVIARAEKRAREERTQRELDRWWRRQR